MFSDMNPVSWTQKRGFIMGKLTFEDKLNVYYEKKEGKSLSYLSNKYNIDLAGIKYLIRLIDKHGFDVLKTNKNRKFSKYEKYSNKK